MSRIKIIASTLLKILTVVCCSFLLVLQAYAAEEAPSKRRVVKEKKVLKLKKLKLSKEQLKRDEEVRKRHSKDAVKNYKVLDYPKLKFFTLKFDLGFITDPYDDRISSSAWEHETFKSPIINLGLYMHNHFSFCRLHLFYGPDISYIKSVEEIAGGKVKLETTGFLLSPEVGMSFHPRNTQFGFSGSFKVPLIRKTKTKLKTASYTKEVNDDIGSYQLGLWVHWYASEKMRPFIRYSFGDDERNAITGGFFYGFN